jgi:hypothetical protein
VQRTIIEKYKRYALKKFATVIMGFRADAILGRFNGPRILLNSIPKSGTHLLERALERMPGIRNAGRRTIHCWDTVDPRVIRILAGIRPGAFLNGHLTALPEVLSTVGKENIKVLVMIRDPRDVVVSYARYLEQIDLTHPASEYICSLQSDGERIDAIIDGVKNLIPSIQELLSRFLAWLSVSNVQICKFEDLVGPRAGGGKIRQEDTIRSIANYLGINVEEKKVMQIVESLYSQKSSTFRNPRLGGWRMNLSDSQKRRMKLCAGELMEKYGYAEW